MQDFALGGVPTILEIAERCVSILWGIFMRNKLSAQEQDFLEKCELGGFLIQRPAMNIKKEMKDMKKKLVVLCMTFVMLVTSVLGGCGKSNEESAL